MAVMLALGVRKATIDVRGTWRRGAITGAVVYRRLYFHCYDCPFGQITDLQRLITIGRSPLPAALDNAALAKSRIAGRAHYTDHPPKFEGKQVQVRIMLFDEPQAPGSADAQYWKAARPLASERSPMQHALAAISADDSIALACLLRAHAFSPEDLVAMLLAAIHSDSPRAAIVELLGVSGADPNSIQQGGNWAGALPLVEAVEQPINVAALLDIGGNPTARDGAGLSALDAARRNAARFPAAWSRCVFGLLSAASRRPVHPGAAN